MARRYFRHDESVDDTSLRAAASVMCLLTHINLLQCHMLHIMLVLDLVYSVDCSYEDSMILSFDTVSDDGVGERNAISQY